MTRFARYGQNNKRTHDATQWTEMKAGEKATQSAGENETAKNDNDNSKANSPKSPLKGVKNNEAFKKPKHKNVKGKFSKGPSKHFSGSKRNPSDFECYNCHKKGHKVSDCPEPGDGKQLEVQCYNCKQKGHKAFKCPKAQQKGPKKRNFMKFDKKKKEDWKAQRSEHRRQKRQDGAQAKLHCYNCRETGHKLSECPEIQGDVEQGTDICFKCGSTEHTVKRCNVKLPPGEFPYAKCFICGETGHLSQKCPDNPRGLYPNGGCCKECGSVEHLQRDCPEFQKQQGIGSVTLERLEDGTSADQEEVDKEKMTKKIKSKGAKVVKF
ncbi:zinc finger CCHC domain-containing protein 9-like [Mercenaria mercenaria]|uniref:zinc finger CCHC domain-containing protein 9-like n=1 Tax=Mercenaria mercenaria TaxID=6596 RepID=UPI00234F5FB7|nr:zinc finger CCHC domain-containing protein 9-like [Mercenaria mercenaria]XP_045156588.2 zinc finger CCHC domain-containing protein 9-like [Mercenaria mercenaria]